MNKEGTAHKQAKRLHHKPEDDTIYAYTKRIWEDAHRKMGAGKYEPVLDAATVHCRNTLPWWK